MTKRKPRKPGSDKSEIVAALPRACVDELSAVEFLEARRWGDTPACPHCGDVSVYKMRSETGERNKRFLWRCHGCKRQFTVRVGTVFEDSRIPLKHWCYAFWMACSSKNGCAALEIKRRTGLSYKSALFLLHRIRFAMAPAPDQPPPKLSGTVEVDEVFLGGRPKGKPWRHGAPTREAFTNKTPVVSVLQRGGHVRSRIVDRVTPDNLRQAIQENVEPGSTILTDDRRAYPRACAGIGVHRSVNHSRGEYVNRDDPTVHTNSVEGFFSLVKRGIHGTYHSVSKTHLHRYLAEFDFRYNWRKVEDGERTAQAIRQADGKRLMYRQPVSPTPDQAA